MGKKTEAERVSISDFKNLRELDEHLSKYLSGCSMEFDEDDQVVLYTGVKATRSGKLKPF